MEPVRRGSERIITYGERTVRKMEQNERLETVGYPCCAFLLFVYMHGWEIQNANVFEDRVTCAMIVNWLNNWVANIFSCRIVNG